MQLFYYSITSHRVFLNLRQSLFLTKYLLLLLRLELGGGGWDII